MKKEKAIEKILKDLRLSHQLEDYVLQTMGRLGCDDTVDIETVEVIEEILRKEINK